MTRQRIHPYIPSYINNEVVLCKICGDKASGIHYNAMSCEGCKAFFRRTVQNNFTYKCCKEKMCNITKMSRTRCCYCRYEKCVKEGMNSSSVLTNAQRVAKQQLIEENKKRKQTEPTEKLSKLSNHLNEEVDFLSDIKAAYQLALECKQNLNIYNPHQTKTLYSEVIEILSQTFSIIFGFLSRIPFFKQLNDDSKPQLVRQNFLSIFYTMTILEFTKKVKFLDKFYSTLESTGCNQVISHMRVMQDLALQFDQLQPSNKEKMLLPLIFFVLDVDLSCIAKSDVLGQLKYHIFRLLRPRWQYREQQLLLRKVQLLSQQHDSVFVNLPNDNFEYLIYCFSTIFDIRDFSN